MAYDKTTYVKAPLDPNCASEQHCFCQTDLKQPPPHLRCCHCGYPYNKGPQSETKVKKVNDETVENVEAKKAIEAVEAIKQLPNNFSPISNSNSFSTMPMPPIPAPNYHLSPASCVSGGGHCSCHVTLGQMGKAHYVCCNCGFQWCLAGINTQPPKKKAAT